LHDADEGRGPAICLGERDNGDGHDDGLSLASAGREGCRRRRSGTGPGQRPERLERSRAQEAARLPWKRRRWLGAGGATAGGEEGRQKREVPVKKRASSPP
jgi:hypothetical protein